MVRSNYVQFVLIVLSVLIIVGALLLCFLMSTGDDQNVIKVCLEDGKTESVKFGAFGEECEANAIIFEELSNSECAV